MSGRWFQGSGVTVIFNHDIYRKTVLQPVKYLGFNKKDWIVSKKTTFERNKSMLCMYACMRVYPVRGWVQQQVQRTPSGFDASAFMLRPQKCNDAFRHSDIDYASRREGLGLTRSQPRANTTERKKTDHRRPVYSTHLVVTTDQPQQHKKLSRIVWCY